VGPAPKLVHGSRWKTTPPSGGKGKGQRKKVRTDGDHKLRNVSSDALFEKDNCPKKNKSGVERGRGKLEIKKKKRLGNPGTGGA